MVLESNEKIIAAAHPLIIAGRAERMESVPCLQRKMLEIIAAGIKKSNTMPRAVKESMCNTKVNHRISRLPPPIPNPVRNPRRIAMHRFKATGIGHLPKSPISPGLCGVIVPEFFDPRALKEFLQHCSRADMEWIPSRRWDRKGTWLRKSQDRGGV